MRQTIFIPSNATVYVIGAPCSGKTTLSQRIAKEAVAKATLISPDEIFKDMFGISATKYAMLPPIAQLQYTTSIIEDEMRYSQKVKLAMFGALMSTGLTIFETAPKCLEEVLSWVKVAAVTRIGSPIIVLKMEPSDEVYRDFCHQRDQIGECLPESALKREVATQKAILCYDYSRIFRNIAQYHVRDPRAVKLEFMS